MIELATGLGVPERQVVRTELVNVGGEFEHHLILRRGHFRFGQVIRQKLWGSSLKWDEAACGALLTKAMRAEWHCPYSAMYVLYFLMQPDMFQDVTCNNGSSCFQDGDGQRHLEAGDLPRFRPLESAKLPWRWLKSMVCGRYKRS